VFMRAGQVQHIGNNDYNDHDDTRYAPRDH